MNLKNSLIKKIRSEFPEVKFKKVEHVTHGYDHDVLVLDEKLIFRFAKKKAYKKSFGREVKFLNSFAKISNLKVPYYTYLSKDKSFGGYKIIPGRALTSKTYQKLALGKKQKIAKELGIFLTRLSKAAAKARKAVFYDTSSWTVNSKGKEEFFKNKLRPKVYKKLNGKQIKFIENFLKTSTHPKYAVKPVPGHHDLNHDHIIVTPKGDISGIIDFGDMSVGDPAYEFSRFFDYDQKLSKQIYKYYKGPKDKLFFERARIHYVHSWIWCLYDALVLKKNKTWWRVCIKHLNKLVKVDNGIS